MSFLIVMLVAILIMVGIGLLMMKWGGDDCGVIRGTS